MKSGNEQIKREERAEAKRMTKKRPSGSLGMRQKKKIHSRDRRDRFKQQLRKKGRGGGEGEGGTSTAI